MAKTMGDVAALEAYLKMISHVQSLAEQVVCHRAVFYSDFIDEDDTWIRPTFSKYVQSGADLGQRMQRSFDAMFAAGFKQVVIVGTDLLDLQVQHIEHAFRALSFHDFVIGPATDGGYYLLGMKELHPSLFTNKHWSTETVCLETLTDMHAAAKSVYQLAEISDIDTEADWVAATARREILNREPK